MNKKWQFVLGFMALVIVASAFGIASELYKAPPPRIRTYIGTLTSISYKHGGLFASISHTILRFENGTEFTLDGEHIYQLGVKYEVTYELYPYDEKVWKVHEIRKVMEE